MSYREPKRVLKKDSQYNIINSSIDQSGIDPSLIMKEEFKEKEIIPLMNMNHGRDQINKLFQSNLIKMSSSASGVSSNKVSSRSIKQSNRSNSVVPNIEMMAIMYKEPKKADEDNSLNEEQISSIIEPQGDDPISDINSPANKIRKRSALQRRSLYNKRLSEMNPAAITDILKRSENNSEYYKAKKTIYYLDLILCIILCFNIILSIVDNEVYIYHSDSYIRDYMSANGIGKIDLNVLNQMEKRTLSGEENLIRFLNTLISVIGVCLIGQSYRIKVKLYQIDDKLSKYDNIFTSGLYKKMIAEMIIIGVCYPPFLNYVLSGTMLGLIYVYNYNSIISIIVFLKLYILGRVFSYYSRWTSDTAVAICNKYKVKSGIQFAIKSEMKKRPEIILSVLLFIVCALLAFAIRTFEYGVIDPTVYDSNTSSLRYLDTSNAVVSQGIKGSNDLQSLTNCFWLIIVTMTTVGYGDYYPKSHLGRFVGVLACIVGMLLLSLIVVSLSSISEFSPEEKKAFSKLKKLLADDNVDNKAANVIKTILLLRKLVMNNQTRGLSRITERFILFTQLKKELSVYKNDHKIANSYALPVDEMLKRLENKLKEDIEKLSKNIKEVNGLDIQLESITKDQENIQEKVKNIVSMQEDIAQYLVNLNNDTFKNNLLKKSMYEKRKSGLSPMINKLSKTPESKKTYDSDVAHIPALRLGGSKLLDVNFMGGKLNSIFKKPSGKTPRKSQTDNKPEAILLNYTRNTKDKKELSAKSDPVQIQIFSPSQIVVNSINVNNHQQVELQPLSLEKEPLDQESEIQLKPSNFSKDDI